MQELTVEAIATGWLDHVKQAAMMDPHTAAELSMGEITDVVADLVRAHGDWLPRMQETAQHLLQAAE